MDTNSDTFRWVFSVGFVAFCLALVFIYQHGQDKVVEAIILKNSKQRFRKRDGVDFYGQRIDKGKGVMYKSDLSSGGRGGTENRLDNRASAFMLSGQPHGELNVGTVAVLAVSENVPLSAFALELQHSLSSVGTTRRLDSETVSKKFGAAAFESKNEISMSSWLDEQEKIHRTILFQCDNEMTPWTQTCLRRANCILLLALPSEDPAVSQLEKQVELMTVMAPKELVLLHHKDGPLLKNTAQWLYLRESCSFHHHVRCPDRVFSLKPQAMIMETYEKLFKKEADRMTDTSRLARMLTGTSIGLVLGGGGARGCAHLGILRALNEARVPVDLIGGVSIGSLMAALWAEETNMTRCMQRARDFCKGMGCSWKTLFDLTYPLTSLFSGAAFNRSLEAVFHDRQIEDLWIPYFNITTDLTDFESRVHTRGSLWRYVRASMSPSGYLPPLCDPVDGHLLLDGGFLNNLPANVMKQMGAKTILAIDVGSLDDRDLTNYGDHLSGWWLLWHRMWPWATSVKVPNFADIHIRLTYILCVQQLEQIKDCGWCEYIRPPIDNFRTLQFGRFNEICDVGYTHGKELMAEWEETGRITDLFS